MSHQSAASPFATLDEAGVDSTSTAATIANGTVEIVTIEAAATTDADAGWVHVCALEDIVPNTGVCAFVGGHQVAVFRVEGATNVTGAPMSKPGQGIFAIGNYDPNSNAAVLSRGLVGNLGDRVVVASPIYKQHFDLYTGECLEASEHAVPCFDTALRGDQIWVHSRPSPDAHGQD